RHRRVLRDHLGRRRRRFAELRADDAEQVGFGDQRTCRDDGHTRRLQPLELAGELLDRVGAKVDGPGICVVEDAAQAVMPGNKLLSNADQWRAFTKRSPCWWPGRLSTRRTRPSSSSTAAERARPTS